VSPTGGRYIALLFHDCGTRRGWVVSSRPRAHFTPGKTRYTFPGGWMEPAPSQSLYWLSYPAHVYMCVYIYMYICTYTCIYKNIYIYVYSLTHTHTHTNTHKCRCYPTWKTDVEYWCSFTRPRSVTFHCSLFYNAKIYNCFIPYRNNRKSSEAHCGQ